MYEIECPYCGLRDIAEFSCHGEAHIVRPKNSMKLSDEEWGDYVFFRSNPKGLHYDRWMHVSGCRRWFNMVRNTATDEILGIYRMGEKPPRIKLVQPVVQKASSKGEVKVKAKLKVRGKIKALAGVIKANKVKAKAKVKVKAKVKAKVKGKVGVKR